MGIERCPTCLGTSWIEDEDISCPDCVHPMAQLLADRLAPILEGK